jgi:hypothetical protein
VYSAYKGGKKYALKQVPYGVESERDDADKEERALELLKGACPYLMNFIEAFEDVCFYFFFLKCFIFCVF